MAIERKSVVDQIEVTSDNRVQVRVALLILDNGVVISSKWHRTAIPVGLSAQTQMAEVNLHLAQMGEPGLSDADLDKVYKVCALAETL